MLTIKQILALLYLMRHTLSMKYCMIWSWFGLVNLMMLSNWFQTPIIKLLVTCQLRQSIKIIYLMITSYCWAYWVNINNIHYMIFHSFSIWAMPIGPCQLAPIGTGNSLIFANRETHVRDEIQLAWPNWRAMPIGRENVEKVANLPT